jgi:hypothetical protein
MMKTPTIETAALARLVADGNEFSVSARAEGEGWVIYVHDQRGARALLDLEGKTAAVFDALQAVAHRLQSVGIAQFEIREQSQADYEAWLKAEVQEALDDPSPLVPHDEAMRRIRAAIKAK